MSTNYYLKIPKKVEQSDDFSELSACEEICQLLLNKTKSSNKYIEEWANEQLFYLNEKITVLKESLHLHAKIHIGKNKPGHRFTLDDKYSSWTEWADYLSNFKDCIVDEYGNEVSLVNLNEIVTNTLNCQVSFPEMRLSKDGYYLSKKFS